MSVSVQLTRLDCTRWSKLLTGPTMAHGPGPAIHHWFSRLASMSSLDASIFRFLFCLFGFSLVSYVQKPPPPPLKEKEVFDRLLDENAIFCPPKQARHKNQTITLPCKKERRLKNNYNGYFLLFNKNGGKI